LEIQAVYPKIFQAQASLGTTLARNDGNNRQKTAKDEVQKKS
jgi:hypothetical protein